MKSILCAAFLLSASAASAAQPLDKVADKLADGLKDRPAIKLAVLEFPYTGGKASEGPVIVQERLLTALSKKKGLTLIERGQLNKVLAELKLQASGAIAEDDVKKLGALLGADAVVTGTLNDLKENRTEVNARAVETATGRILAAASAQLEKTWKDTAAVQPPPKDFGAKPLVQVAVLLDTSNSMDGLINQARSQIWKIVNELVTAEKGGSAPAIEVALYEYGNSGLKAESGYIRQVTPFTRDLDKVSQELFALTTNGGDEYCGKAIAAAVRDLKWNPKNDVYKAVFIAGNEPFTQGPESFAAAAAAAKAKGIFVNTIYCGSRQQGMAEQWLAGAQAADGDYTNIDQAAQVYTAAAPQDARIAELSSKLDNTAVAYGAAGRSRGAAQAKFAGALAAAAPSAVSERAVFKAQSSFSAEADAEWDAVSALEAGTVKREELKKDQLPAELQKLDKKQLDKYFDEQLAQRSQAKQEIVRLQSERKAYLAAEEKKQGGAQTLDKAMINTIRKQAERRGYTFK